jgi:hypothetical protein
LVTRCRPSRHSEAVGTLQKKRLSLGMIRAFQNEPDSNKSSRQWKQIEKEVFGVEYHD